LWILKVVTIARMLLIRVLAASGTKVVRQG
jgi:hypothetical protein